MKRILKDLNRCKCLKGVSIEKRIIKLMFDDAIDKGLLLKNTRNELYYTREEKGVLNLLERDREFDEKLVTKMKRKYKNEND